jgi:hypothetical protein
MKPLTPGRGPAASRPRPRLLRSFEQLEIRSLLAGLPALDLEAAVPLDNFPASRTGAVAPGAPALFEIDPADDARLLASVATDGPPTRLSLLDADGNLLVQSDGQTAHDRADLIDQHVVAGRQYLEVQTLAGPTEFTLEAHLSLSSQPNQPASASSGKVAFGDLTGDGLLDFVDADGIHYNEGDGTFADPTPLPLTLGRDTEVTALATGDLYGDGRLDIAVAEYDHRTSTTLLQVLRSEGNGTFQAGPTKNLGDIGMIESLVTGDFTGDGRVDLAATYYYFPAGYSYYYGSPGLDLLSNEGGGVFSRPTKIDLGNLGGNLDVVAAGPFTADGHDDLVVAGSAGSTFELETLASGPSGKFEKVSELAVSVFPAAMATGVFADNGRLDVAVAGSNAVEVFLNDGDGTFRHAQTIKTGDLSPNALAVGAFGANGNADICVAGRDSVGQSELEILTGTGDGTFRAQPARALGQADVTSLVSGDFIQQPVSGQAAPARTDLAAVETSGPDTFGVVVLPGEGDGSVGEATTAASTSLPVVATLDSFVGIVSGQFAADGGGDLAVVTGPIGQESIDVLLSNGDGTYREAPPILLGDVDVTSLVSGDFTNDGRSDIALVEHDFSSGDDFLDVLRANGDGTFTVEPPFDLPPSESAPRDLTVGHFTSNGDLDLALIVTVAKSPTLSVFLGNGRGAFSPAPQVTTKGLVPQAIVAGPFSGDGLDDLFVVGSGQSGKDFIETLTSLGNGTFKAGSSVGIGSVFPESIVTGDFNGDGRTDVALLGSVYSGSGYGYDYYYTEVVEELRGDGQGSFAAPTSLPVSGFTPNDIASTRFEGDDRDSLVVAGFDSDRSTGAIQILRDDTGGTFVGSTPATLGDVYPDKLVVGDFDGGGRIDFAITTGSDSSFAEVLRGPQAFGNLTPATPTAFFNGSFFTTTGPFVAGDFNGDGRPDAAIAGTSSAGGASVRVLLGNGQGAFQAQPTIEVAGFTPLFLAAGEFDGSGVDDLAVVGYDARGQASVAVIMSELDTTFRVFSPIDLGEFQPVAVAAGQFVGDGQVDLAIAGIQPDGQSILDILRGHGDGTFEAEPPIALSGLIARALAPGAFAGDGHDDLAVAGDDPSGEAIVELISWRGATFSRSKPLDVGAFDVAAAATGAFVADGAPGLALLGNDERTGQVDLEVVPGGDGGAFEAPAPIVLGPGFAEGLLAGDFTGNGRTDLIAVSGFAPTVEWVLLNKGNGTFGAPIASGLTELPAPTVATDFNGDGRTDMGFSTGGADAFQVALSLGDGLFASPGDFTGVVHDNPLVADLGTGADDVFVVDQSGDILWRKGIPASPGMFEPPVVINPGFPSRDIVLITTARGPIIASVDLDDDAVSLYAFEGGQFVRTGSLPTGQLPAQIIAADLTGHGDLDLIIRNAGDGTATVYLGDGAGDFAPAPVVPIGAGASSIAAGQLTANGPVDLVVSDHISGQVLVFPGLGDGRFGAPGIYAAGAGPYAMETTADGAPLIASLDATSDVAIGPLSPGGAPAIAAVGPGSNTLAILAGLGGGAFANPTIDDTPTPGQLVRYGVIGGRPFLAVLESDGVSVYLGDRHGGFGPPTTYPAGSNPTGLAIADLDGGGTPDILVGDGFGDVLVLLGNGSGGFAPPVSTDQQIALAVANPQPGAPPQFVIADQGSNKVSTQSSPTAKSTTLSGASQGILAPGAVALADLNGDGIPDAIVANSGANEILVYLGRGDGRYVAPLAFPVGTDPVSVTVADLTGDGIPDLIVANRGSNDLSILLGESKGADWTMKPLERLKTGYGPTDTATTTLQPGGLPDILVSASESDEVQLLKAIGGGYYDDHNPTVYQTGVNPGPILVGNFTGRPGQVDMATLNAGSNTLSVFLGINGPDVVTQTLASGGNVPIAAVEGEFEGQQTGLLVANNADGELALFLGGPNGLSLSETFEEPELPNPTALVMDDNGGIFGGTEGVDGAIAVTLGLGAPSPSGSPGPQGSPGPPGPPGPLLQQGSGEQQVALLQPLSQSSLALVATLLSLAVETNAENGAGQVAALPNQTGTADVSPQSSDEGEPEDNQDATPPEAPGQGYSGAVARFLAGVDEAFARARDRALRGSILVPAGTEDRLDRRLSALDEVLELWSPAIISLGGARSRLLVQWTRSGLALARAVDAYLRSLGAGSPVAAPGDAGDRAALEVRAKPTDATLEGVSDPEGPADGSTVRASSTTPRSGLEIGLIKLSLVLVARPFADRAWARMRYPDRTHQRPGTARHPRDATP